MSTEQTITGAICSLLAENGYENTTYRDVAEKSGFDRAHVQYYYPNKKLFAGAFYRRMLKLSAEFLEGKGYALDAEDPIPFAHAVGQLDYSFMQMNEEMRKLTGEMLEYRSIGAMLIEIEYEWMDEHSFYSVNRSPEGTGFDEFVFWNGGVFECLHEAATTGAALDADLVASSLIEHSAEAGGKDKNEIRRRLASSKLPDELIREGCAFMWKQIRASQGKRD